MEKYNSREPAVLVPGGRRDLTALKEEVQRRANRGIPPLGGIAAVDARAALSRIDSLDRDGWARAWCDVADRYAADAQGLEQIDTHRATRACWNAWRLYHFARWPTENSPVRRHAKQRALETFARYASLVDPPIERVHIPFEGGYIPAYLRLPPATAPAPLVFGIAGLDSRKEDVAAHTEGYLKRGLGLFAVDLPGTGESPIAPSSVDADRLFSVALDYLATRSDVDAQRIVVQGRSWSGYWAAKLAVTESTRLRGCVMHGGPIHHYFQPEWLKRSLETDEYLYDYLEAKCAMFGATNLEIMLERARAFSLLDLGLLDKPSAPMLLVNGARDSQIPIGDLFLLLEHGSAKDAWVNPAGGHMGRSIEWPSSRIADEVVLPWIARIMNG
ncbi:MAG TPA: alpha/beta hydrolase [Burkholderiales bacterium]|nr:alpha/beta hydrolase [Burkholderiales bacterium]